MEQEHNPGHSHPGDPSVPHDGRGREPGVHPTVARSGRSRTTAIAFIAALVGAAVLYALIVIGITLPGI